MSSSSPKRAPAAPTPSCAGAGLKPFPSPPPHKTPSSREIKPVRSPWKRHGQGHVLFLFFLNANMKKEPSCSKADMRAPGLLLAGAIGRSTTRHPAATPSIQIARGSPELGRAGCLLWGGNAGVTGLRKTIGGALKGRSLLSNLHGKSAGASVAAAASGGTSRSPLLEAIWKG